MKALNAMWKHVALVLRVLLTVYTLTCMVLSLFMIWLVQQIARVILYPFTTVDQRIDVCGHIFRKVSYIMVVLPNPAWWTTIVKPFPKIDRKKHPKFLVMMNHVSNADAYFSMLPMGFWLDCKWICKGSLLKVPIGGWALGNGGDLPIKFTSEKDGWGTEKGSVAELMASSKKYLDRGQPIAIYPEGIRNKLPYGPLNEFKRGFFQLAVDEGASIVPMAFTGTGSAWPRDDWKIGCAHVYISSGEPISSKGHTADSLIAAVRTKIDELRSAHPDYIAYHKKKH